MQPKCDETVSALADTVISEVEQHSDIRDRKVKIDFLFAYPDYDEKTGEPLNVAIKQHGSQCVAIVRKIGIKDRLMGRGDIEITLDGDHWAVADREEQKAILDHELTHVVVCEKTDDLGRPKILLRDHDYQFGWFRDVARRRGMHSVECQQAATMMENSGQIFWPSIVEESGSRMTRLEIKGA